MPGIKRRIETGDDHRGKRTKVKTASVVPTSKGAKKNYVPPAFQKRGITKSSQQFNKERKIAKEHARAEKSKKSQKQKRDDDDDLEEAEDSDEEMDSEDGIDDTEEDNGSLKDASGHQSQSPITGQNLQSNGAAEPGKGTTSTFSCLLQ
jgi:pumilio family protein 6